VPGRRRPARGVRAGSARGEGSRPAIVCGVAGADEARSAAIVAGQLAEALDATLVLVYSRLATAGFGDRPPTRHGIGNWELLAEHERRVALRGLARAARWSGRRPERVALVLEVGDPAERIKAVARRTNAALAIVGCRGGGSLRAAVRGSTCRALAARARRPVVICTKQASPRLLAGTPLAAPSCCVVRPPDLRCGAPASPERRAAAPP
jgi:nucleotide-binding universal stress UspA family protein